MRHAHARAAKMARPGLFRWQNSPPGPKSPKFHRKSAPPDLPEVTLEVASSEVTRTAAISAFLELVTGVTGVTGAGEVVAGPAAGTPLPHAPGVRMT